MTLTLDAVNRVLSTVGLRPVATLDGAVSATTALAQRLLEEQHVSILNEGWSFNVFERVTRYPDAENHIEVGVDAIRWEDEASPFITIRDGRLFDTENETDEFLAARTGRFVRPIPFESCPLAYRDYVAISAGRRMQAQYRGDVAGARDAIGMEQRAQAVARNADQAMVRYSSSENPTVRRITGRPMRRRRIW
jgi:hypothetical protein